MKKFLLDIWNWLLHEDGHLDWLKHFIVGTWLFIFVTFIMVVVQDDIVLSLTVSNFTTAILSALKEVYDQYVKKTESDARDIIWTISGGLILTLLHIIYVITR